jgi:hypothetical protein
VPTETYNRYRVAGVNPSRGTAKVKSDSEPVVNNGDRATGATAVAIFDTISQAATDAHSN